MLPVDCALPAKIQVCNSTGSFQILSLALAPALTVALASNSNPNPNSHPDPKPKPNPSPSPHQVYKGYYRPDGVPASVSLVSSDGPSTDPDGGRIRAGDPPTMAVSCPWGIKVRLGLGSG